MKTVHCKERGRFCSHVKIYESGYGPDNEIKPGIDHMMYSYNEGGVFYVGDEFGCVHGKRGYLTIEDSE